MLPCYHSKSIYTQTYFKTFQILCLVWTESPFNSVFSWLFVPYSKRVKSLWTFSISETAQKLCDLVQNNIRPLRHLHLYLQTRMAHTHLSGMSLNPVGKVSLFLTHRHHLGTSASPLNAAWQGLHTDRANEASRPVVLYSSAQPRPPCCKADWGCLAGQSENLLLSNCPRSDPDILAWLVVRWSHTLEFFLSCCNV